MYVEGDISPLEGVKSGKLGKKKLINKRKTNIRVGGSKEAE